MTTSRPSDRPSVSAGPRRGLPPAMGVALLVVLVELGAVGALAVGMLVETVGGNATTPGPTIVMALMFLGLVTLLAAAVRALWQGRRWGRGPVITWQLLLLAVGVSQASSLVWWVVTLLVVLPVVVTVGILLPPSVDWTAPASPPRA